MFDSSYLISLEISFSSIFLDGFTARIARVVIGVREPDTFISATSGLKVLIDAGITIEYCDELRDECLALNQHLEERNLLVNL